MGTIQNLTVAQLIQSYVDWPSSVSASALAANGFKFTGKNDTVECVSCGTQLSNWKESDNINQRHSSVSPGCSYVTNDTTTVSSNHFSNTYLSNSAHTSDSRSLSQISLSSNTNNNTSNKIQKSQFAPTQSGFPIPVTFSADGSYKVLHDTKFPDTIDGVPGYGHETNLPGARDVVSEPIAKMAEYQSENSRLNSYSEWPSDAPVDPHTLARAGLFYTGLRDKVKCPFCLGAMYNWEDGDNPFIEHQKHYPECKFVKYRMHCLLHVNESGSAETIRSACQSEPVARSASSSPTASLAPSTNNHSPLLANGNKLKENICLDDIPCVPIVNSMGYSIRMIKLALQRIKDWRTSTLSSATLLDAIFEVEENGYDSDDADNNQDSNITVISQQNQNTSSQQERVPSQQVMNAVSQVQDSNISVSIRQNPNINGQQDQVPSQQDVNTVSQVSLHFISFSIVGVVLTKCCCKMSSYFSFFSFQRSVISA